MTLDRFILRISSRFRTTRRVLGYRVCLMQSLGNGQWECARTSATITFDYILTPGQTHAVPASKAEIPVDGCLRNIKGDWLALSVDVQGDGAAGVVYAQSQNWKAL